MPDMDTWHDLIREWGGPAAFGKSLGISKAAADKMSQRNNVHVDHWPCIVARAPHAGLDGITIEFLASLKRGRQFVRRFRGPTEANQVAV